MPPVIPAVLRTIGEMRHLLAARGHGQTIGFVPTMGALHAGHARLIEQARADTGTVVVSIFVNPLQFDRKDDLDRYPRTWPDDVELCQRLGVDVIFAPDATEIYPSEPACTIQIRRLADHLCGRFRPGHFEGVATVVMKLFQIVQPSTAYFGEKDAQQLAIIRRVVADFNLPVEIVGIPTVRDADGLALSSRNQHLTPEQRSRSVSLHEALTEAARLIAGGMRDAGSVKQLAAATIPGDEALRLEYLEIVDPAELQPVEKIEGPVLVAGAMWVGTTRLIDNITCPPSAS